MTHFKPTSDSSSFACRESADVTTSASAVAYARGRWERQGGETSSIASGTAVSAKSRPVDDVESPPRIGTVRTCALRGREGEKKAGRHVVGDDISKAQGRTGGFWKMKVLFGTGVIVLCVLGCGCVYDFVEKYKG